MSTKAAITVQRPRDDVERLWETAPYRPEYLHGLDAQVTFRDAPGDRGTEVHVDLQRGAPGGTLGDLGRKLSFAQPLAKAKDDLRRFKQLVETGQISRSDGVPEGELAERKVKQRPAQPLGDSELERAGS